MNKQQRSISSNSVSPFRKQHVPLPRVPLTFGVNLELQKRKHYLQFYDQYSNQKLECSQNNQQMQYVRENVLSKQEDRSTQSKLSKKNSSFNDIYFENITTNATNVFDSQTRRATSKLSNYSANNSKSYIKPPIQINIYQKKSQVESFNQNRNSSFILKEVNESKNYLNRGVAPRSISSKNSLRDKADLHLQKNTVNKMQVQSNQSDDVNKQNQYDKKFNKHSFVHDFAQDNTSFILPDQPKQYNPVHQSFYHNYHDQYKPIQQNLMKEIENHSFSKPKAQNSIKQADEKQKDEKVQISYLKSKKTSKSFNGTINNLNNETLNQNKKIKLVGQRYKKLQDPNKILQYIEQKEIGFDTTADILSAIQIAQKNTDEQFINKKRQPLAPIPVWQEENKIPKKTNVKHIQKFDLDFNQIDEEEINKYIIQKEDFLNEIEINRYKERYNLNKEKQDLKLQKKQRDQVQNEQEKEHDSFENLHFSLSRLEITKSDSPNLEKIKIKNAKDSPKVVISTKQSSFDMKYGSIQPLKKYQRDFDEYSIQQKYLMRTQEQSPLNNGYSGKNEKAK